MNHNQLIAQLTHDLKPVRPLRSPLWREAAMWVIAIIGVVLGVIYWYHRKDEFHIPSGRAFAELLFLIVSAKITARLAVRSVSPHHAVPKTKLSSWGPLLAWTALLAAAFTLLYLKNPEEAMIAAQYKTWLCPTLIVTIAIPIGLFMFVFLIQGAVLFPRTTALYLGQTIFVLGAIGLSFICPWTDPLHELLWHVVPVGLLTLGSALIFWIAFRLISWWKLKI